MSLRKDFDNLLAEVRSLEFRLPMLSNRISALESKDSIIEPEDNGTISVRCPGCGIIVTTEKGCWENCPCCETELFLVEDVFNPRNNHLAFKAYIPIDES